MTIRSSLLSLLLFICFMTGRPLPSSAYSVLTHEAIVDACWQRSFVLYLKLKYPNITEEELKQAHAYAYGGAIAPDMGYFPMGSKLFTNLAHYVRSGDLVHTLIDEAANANELAFALGFLTHYMADVYGHSLGINKAVPLIYPRLQSKYGNVITYAEDQVSHKRVEFSFDVLQVSKGNYASEAYHDFIGFAIAGDLLARTVVKIYGLTLKDLFPHFSLSVRLLRLTVKSLFPAITQSAWLIHKNALRKQGSSVTDRSFRNRMYRINYYQDSGTTHKTPTFFLHLFSWFIRVVPKMGPLKALKIQPPGTIAETMFIHSFDTVSHYFNAAVPATAKDPFRFSNKDLDTGDDTHATEYELADKTYGELLLKLRKGRFRNLNNELRDNILGFYSHTSRSIQAADGKEKKVAQALVMISQ
jgi:hypothetical protein